jgi:hypothetical protein
VAATLLDRGWDLEKLGRRPSGLSGALSRRLATTHAAKQRRHFWPSLTEKWDVLSHWTFKEYQILIFSLRRVLSLLAQINL